jgi:tricorn protease
LALLASEWRGYRGGQNTALVLLDLETLDEVLLPNERTIDIHPVWLGDRIYFLSDRDWLSNVWSYDVATGALEQVTRFTDVDVKTLAGHGDVLVYEHDGWIHRLDPATGESRKLDITIRGDFPWAMPRWVDASRSIREAALSATGQRAVMEARGEIFTVPVEHGSVRNLTRTPGAADRAPVWSPDGERVAWFSDDGTGYRLMVGSQDGLSEPRSYDIGESKMAWAPAWAPNGNNIAFVDDRLRIRVIWLDSGEIMTADNDGLLASRTAPGPVWSPDSRWLAYAKSFPNHLRRIVVWSLETGEARPVTDAMAHAVSPAWDRDGRHLWFLASTELGRAAGWANTSSISASPRFGAYVTVLRADDPSPFMLRSSEEPAAGAAAAAPADTGAPRRRHRRPAASTAAGDATVRIDFAGIERRIVPLPMPVRRTPRCWPGPRAPPSSASRSTARPAWCSTSSRWPAVRRRSSPAAPRGVAVSGDGKKLMFQAAGSGAWWRRAGRRTRRAAGSV